MKRTDIRVGAMLLTAALFTGLASCSPEKYASPDIAGIPVASEYADAVQIDVNQETNYVTFSFTGKRVMPVWIIDGKSYSSSFSMTRYYRKAGDYSVDVKIANANGMSDGAVTKTFHIDKTIMNGFGGFVYESDFNLWHKASVEAPTFYYAPGWAQLPDPSCGVSDGAYTLTLPEATTDTWQAQMKLATNISTSAANHYDFSIILTSTLDHPHVMVKLVDDSDDNVFYCAETIALTANEPVCFWKSDMDGIDIAKLDLVLDFGGNAAGSVVTAESIVFKDHADDDGTQVPEQEIVPDPVWADVDGEDNLWHGVSFTNTFYYAPGWEQLPDPAMTVDGNAYSFVFPSATTDQWQNQIAFVTDGLALSAAEKYDFKVTLQSNNAIPAATVKLAQNDDDGIFLFELRPEVPAGGDIAVKAINVDGKDISQAKIVFDFGGNPDGTELTIKDIILQTHKE